MGFSREWGMKRSTVSFPGYEAAEIYTRDGAALLLPVSEVQALEVARAEERRARVHAAGEVAREVTTALALTSTKRMTI